MTLLDCYQRDQELNRISYDPAQISVVRNLQELYDQLCIRSNEKQSFFSRLIKPITGTENEPVRGIYLWGGVGRGKTRHERRPADIHRATVVLHLTFTPPRTVHRRR